MTNKEIEQIANDVLAQYLKKGSSYKLFEQIMADKNIRYREVESDNSFFIGCLTQNINERFFIVVNNSIDHIGRKNFTIAHELGHYFLSHSLKQGSFFCQNNQIVEEGVFNDPIEQEANHFASCFLMPEEKIKSAFLSILLHSRKAKRKDFLLVTNDYSFGIWKGIKDELTKRYGVSEAALRFRLQQLDLAKFEFV
jgi:Zn-dependent peptidase ImmA (M78 family)